MNYIKPKIERGTNLTFIDGRARQRLNPTHPRHERKKLGLSRRYFRWFKRKGPQLP
jgi:hypothetical protein